MILAKLQITTEHVFIKDAIYTVQDFPEIELKFVEKSRIDAIPFFKIEGLDENLNLSIFLLKGVIYNNETIGVIFATEKISLQYSADYTASYTHRSLVDRGYVDNQHRRAFLNGG